MYIVFAGDHYYPSGGMQDFIGNYATKDEAIAAAAGWDWAQVVLLETLDVEMEFESGKEI